MRACSARSFRNCLAAVVILGCALAPAAQGAVFYVAPAGAGDGTTSGNPAGLQAALDAAENNGESDVLRLAVGSGSGAYLGNFAYVGAAGEDHDLVIEGGWSADYSTRRLDPANTVLDGNDTGRVLDVDNATNSARGSVRIEGLTIRNGSATGIVVQTREPGAAVIDGNVIEDNTSTGAGGLVVNAADRVNHTAGPIIVQNNIIRNNLSGSDSSSGGGYIYSGHVTYFRNNLIYGNVVPGTTLGSGKAGGFYFNCYGGHIYIVNNTITANTAYTYGGGLVIRNGGAWAPTHYYLTNNIVHGNAYVVGFLGDQDILNDVNPNAPAGGGNTILFSNNIYSGYAPWPDHGGTGIPSVTPTFTDNVTGAAPVYLGGGDYHLASGSPGIDAGTGAYPEVPPGDLDGYPRRIDGNGDAIAVPDVGAYEFRPAPIVRGALLYPAGGEVIPSGGEVKIQWYEPSLGSEHTRVLFSSNNGLSWSVVEKDVQGRMHEWWEAPTPRQNVAKALIKIVGYTDAGKVLGTSRSGPFAIEVVKVLSPNGGEGLVTDRTHRIRWRVNGTAAPAASTLLYFTINGGRTWFPIAEIPAPPEAADYPSWEGGYDWMVPASVTTSSAKIRAVVLDASRRTLGSDTSDAMFRFGGVVVTSPNGGEDWTADDVYDIAWEAVPEADSFTILLSQDGGLTWKKLAEGVASSPYSLTMPVPRGNKTRCRVRVLGYQTATGRKFGDDRSDGVFSISVLKVTTPNGGEALTGGVPQRIAWKSYGLSGQVARARVFVTLDGGRSWRLVFTSTAGDPNPGSCDWTPPAVAATRTRCKAKVVLSNAAGAVLGTDLSDGWFSVLKP